MIAEERKLRPIFRLGAIVVGSLWIVGSLIFAFALAQSRTAWYAMLLSVGGVVFGLFFLYVGITGINYALEKEEDDHER